MKVENSPTVDFYDLETLMAKVRKFSIPGSVFEKLGIYIEQNASKVIFMTASELASQVGISQGSVSRFCSEIGFRGYADFQHELRYYVKRDSEELPEQEYSSESKKVGEIIRKEKKCLENLKLVVERDSYSQALEMLRGADRVILISSRLSGTLLHYFAYNLCRIGKEVLTITENDLMWEACELITDKKTVFFTISFPEYSHSIIFKLERLKERGLPVIGLTDSGLSPISALVEPLILLPVVPNVPFGEFGTPMTFLSILVQDLFSVSSDKRHLKELSDIEEDAYVYHKAWRIYPHQK